MMFSMVLFVCFYDSAVSARLHSLRYFYMAVHGAPPDFPEFISAGFLDDIQIDWYDSITQNYKLKQEWMNQSEISKYWLQEKEKLKHSQKAFTVNVKTGMERVNKTEGVHTAQRMYGCEWKEGNIATGFVQDGFDGRDFIAFDSQALTWTAAVPAAVMTKNKWDANRDGAKQLNLYLKEECVSWLKKYIQYGNTTLERKVRPSTTLSVKTSPTTIICSCFVVGFYPSEIDINWIRNETVKIDQVESSGILPNYDGTYSLRQWIEIDLDDWNHYSCQVEHSSMDVPELHKSGRQCYIPDEGEKEKLNSNMIAGVTLIPVFILAVVIGLLMWRRKRVFYEYTAPENNHQHRELD
ncbi:major histocompatibility complex class I-related gene protein-like [Protopterus annectens]|uniref:major histocompatibility complex class I-related gene protein-like n=1 Tax=Protopterus annectens TaxID=7888 RepID=UPI001CF9A401|nr:major histocompatibility complex class I-related gene protein-like [Protopterus annectens]